MPGSVPPRRQVVWRWRSPLEYAIVGEVAKLRNEAKRTNNMQKKQAAGDRLEALLVVPRRLCHAETGARGGALSGASVQEQPEALSRATQVN